MRMYANYTNNKENKLIYPKLSYVITGICFDVHNELGRYAREKQYADRLEIKLKEAKIPYEREHKFKELSNRVDFFIDGRIILELKAKNTVDKEDYYQTQRYLQMSNVKLGLIINFGVRYLKPIRVIRIDTDVRKKFV